MPGHVDNEVIGTPGAWPQTLNIVMEGTVAFPPVVASSFEIKYYLYGEGIHNETVATGDGVTTEFSGYLMQNFINPNTVQFTATISGVGQDLTDDGNGNLTGYGSGTIDYRTGEFSLVWTDPPDDTTNIDFSGYYSGGLFNWTATSDAGGTITGYKITNSTINYTTGEYHIEFEYYLDEGTDVLASYDSNSESLVVGSLIKNLPAILGESYVENSGSLIRNLPTLSAAAQSDVEIDGVLGQFLPIIYSTAEGFAGVIGNCAKQLAILELAAIGYLDCEGGELSESLPALVLEAYGKPLGRFDGYVLRYVR